MDGKQVAQGKIERTIPARFSLDETFDVGEDTGTPVVEDYVDKMPFKFTGVLKKVVDRTRQERTCRDGSNGTRSNKTRDRDAAVAHAQRPERTQRRETAMQRNATLRHCAAVRVAAAIGFALAIGGFSAATDAADALGNEVAPPKVAYSPYADQQFPSRVFWGVAHIHTGYSFDAGMFGITLTPEELFKAARGDVVVVDNGQRFKLNRPLDWLAITDHAEYMGVAGEIHTASPACLANPTCKGWYDAYKTSPAEGTKAAIAAVVGMGTGKAEFDARSLVTTAWAHATAAAERWNQPGVFTTLHGFEWTSAPGGKNLHRTVIFRDNADRVTQVVPFSVFDSQDPADLWKYMDAYATKTGGSVLAIPHNPNLSAGIMFTAETYEGKPMDRAYAEARIGHEPLMEVTQVKGDSETHPFLSPTDEFADFERTWTVDFGAKAPDPNTALAGSHARSALKLGLELDAKLGANPYQFGMIGGSDNHTGVISEREDNFFGEFANGLPSPERWKTPLLATNDGKPLVSVWNEQAAGLGGVWARENTREAIWDALKRKEVYATTGDRPTVRVFAGWDFAPADLDRSDFAANGYAHGVPMGGNLVKAPAPGKPPAFLVYAMRDPEGPNLDRLQIIKGWLDKDGNSQERVFDVAVSGGRKIDRDGRCKTSVGNTVDVANASYTQQHRRRNVVRVLEGSDVRRDAARVLLRARHSDSVAALDRVRPETFRHQDGRLRSDDGHRPRVHVADLVHAITPIGNSI